MKFFKKDTIKRRNTKGMIQPSLQSLGKVYIAIKNVKYINIIIIWAHPPRTGPGKGECGSSAMLGSFFSGSCSILAINSGLAEG
jgi:hypothetical protein